MSTSHTAATDHSVHPVDERLPLGKTSTLGLQHVLVMYAGAVAAVVLNLFFNGSRGDAREAVEAAKVAEAH